MDSITYKKSKATKFLHKLSLVIFFCGYPNFWVEQLNLPKIVIKFFEHLTSFINILIYGVIISEFGALVTQNHLNERQRSNLLVFSVSHPMLFFFVYIMVSYEKNVREVFYSLHVTLKKIHNDLGVEEDMIKRTIRYQFALAFSCILSSLMYTIDAIMNVRNGGTYTTLITAYPDVTDKSHLANITRVICYLVWLVLISRIIGLYLLVIPIPTGLSHQFKNLKRYFESLNDIFEKKNISQSRKEELYEEKIIVGIKLHIDTLRFLYDNIVDVFRIMRQEKVTLYLPKNRQLLRCGEKAQAVCSVVFSGQIIFNILLLVLLLSQMVNSDRTFMNVCSAVLTAIAVLISTGFYMWNSGDITVEASELGTSIYFSGWHNCYGPSSVRIRKLVVVTIANAQKPVQLKGLGYINLSYESYIRIVKWSYSVFSVLF